MLHPLAQFNTRAGAFAAGWMIIDNDVRWLFSEGYDYAVTAMINPLDTRMIHQVKIGEDVVEAISLSEHIEGVDALFRALLISVFGRTTAERDAAKLEAYDQSMLLCGDSIASAHELLDAVITDQHIEDDYYCDAICAECIKELTGP
jgi:hypothetical protein